MKQFLFLLLIAGFSTAEAQVGVGTTTPDASAGLDVQSTTKGFLPPRMTSAQRAAIANPANGLMVFQTDGTRGIYYYDSPQWINLTTGISPDVNGLATSLITTIVSTFAGDGLAGSDDSPSPLGPSYASFHSPMGMAKDAAGNLYVVDSDNYKIRKVSTTGSVSTLASVGSGTNSPQCIVLDASGNCYVTMYGGLTILKITPAGVVSTYAGSGNNSVTDGAGTSASFSRPLGIAIDAVGNLYVADQNNIRKINPLGVVTTLVASSAYYFTTGLTVSPAGYIYASTENNVITKISPTGVVQAFAGSGVSGATDGLGTAATFFNVSGLTLDSGGNLYATDGFNKIRRITLSGLVTTLAGNGYAGYAEGIVAAFDYPRGIVMNNDGFLYVADRNNNRIRKIYILPGTQPN